MYGADLRGAKLREVNFQDADLRQAELQEADLLDADLRRADLRGADLSDAELLGTDLDGAKLSNATLFRTHYEPATVPAPGYLTGLRRLTTLRFDPGRGSGVAQLRAQLAEIGLRNLERQATYALERQITRHKLGGDSSLEGAFRLAFFEWTTGYGLRPGRALLILLVFIGVFAGVYIIPLATAAGRIYCVWPEGRLEESSNRARLAGEAEVERLHPRGRLAVLGRALQFSILSAFHLGWRELNVGSWIARVQTREYTLRATGWVRTVAGVQSLTSIYLVALWALTYFGRPFQ